jgi:uncharacterized protein YjiS (DUF1127 family)
MSVTHSTVVRPAALRRLGTCLESVARYFVYRAAIAHLGAFDDDALRDIGLARSGIEAAVRGCSHATKA